MNEEILICDICDKEIDICDIAAIDSEIVCQTCWHEWEMEKKEMEREYWNSRL